MQKRICGLLLAVVLVFSNLFSSFASQNHGVAEQGSDTKNVTSINIDDPNSPYLVDSGYLPNGGIVLFGSSRPRSEWNLYDNQYSWSADIKGNSLYSNYYFTGHGGRFLLYAYQPFSSNVNSYTITIYKRKTTSGSSTSVRTFRVPTNRDVELYSEHQISGNDQFYFKISGGRNAQFGVNGYVDTY